MHRVPELQVTLHHDVQDALILVTELVLVELAHDRWAARIRARPDRRPRL